MGSITSCLGLHAQWTDMGVNWQPPVIIDGYFDSVPISHHWNRNLQQIKPNDISFQYWMVLVRRFCQPIDDINSSHTFSWGGCLWTSWGFNLSENVLKPVTSQAECQTYIRTACVIHKICCCCNLNTTHSLFRDCGQDVYSDYWPWWWHSLNWFYCSGKMVKAFSGLS